MLTKRRCFEGLNCHCSCVRKDSSALTGTQGTLMASKQYSHFWSYCFRSCLDVHSPWVFLSLSHRLKIRNPGFSSGVILEFLNSRRHQLVIWGCRSIRTEHMNMLFPIKWLSNNMDDSWGRLMMDKWTSHLLDYKLAKYWNVSQVPCCAKVGDLMLCSV